MASCFRTMGRKDSPAAGFSFVRQTRIRIAASVPASCVHATVEQPPAHLHSAWNFVSMIQRMKQTIWILPAALIGVGIVIAQEPADRTGRPAGGAANGQNKGQTKGAPRNPTQSPASQRPPQTVKPQTYPTEQIQAGELRFTLAVRLLPWPRRRGRRNRPRPHSLKASRRRQCGRQDRTSGSQWTPGPGHAGL